MTGLVPLVGLTEATVLFISTGCGSTISLTCTFGGKRIWPPINIPKSAAAPIEARANEGRAVTADTAERLVLAMGRSVPAMAVVVREAPS